MRVVLVLILLVELVCINRITPTLPDGYYNYPCQQPLDVGVVEWLAALEWVGPLDLSGGGWDCSQMSARVEWLLETCGHPAVIAYDEGHAWVLVDVDGAQLAYEATGNYWVFPEDAELLDLVTDYYHPDGILDGLACRDTRPGEYDWWATHPELLGG